LLVFFESAINSKLLESEKEEAQKEMETASYEFGNLLIIFFPNVTSRASHGAVSERQLDDLVSLTLELICL
jgi:hypothetical protein